LNVMFTYTRCKTKLYPLEQTALKNYYKVCSNRKKQ
jgi:hypothetical protein